MTQKAAGSAGILRGHHRYRSQELRSAAGEVTQIAERSRDNVEGTGFHQAFRFIGGRKRRRGRRGARPYLRPLRLLRLYTRCCLILPSSVALGTAPMTVSTCCPFLKKRMLGIERTLKRIAVR